MSPIIKEQLNDKKTLYYLDKLIYFNVINKSVSIYTLPEV
jgi:hypothetical protein